MKPGSRVHAEITIADLDSAITVPRQAICNLDGTTVVYRWRRGEFTATEIELGPAAFGRVVVTSGLEDGDVIALRDPTTTEDQSEDKSGISGAGPARWCIVTLRDAFGTAIENLSTHKLRSVLTMLGMIFGVGAVIAMLSIGEGAERQAMEMIERLGVRNILVRDIDMRDEELQEVRETSPGVSPRDAVAIADAIPGVERTCARVEIEPYTVLSGGRTVKATAHGVDATFAGLTNLEVTVGRFFDERGCRPTRPGLRHRRVRPP